MSEKRCGAIVAYCLRRNDHMLAGVQVLRPSEELVALDFCVVPVQAACDGLG